VKNLRSAIRQDQKFAAAYASLSGIYAMLAVDGFMRPTDAWPEVNKNMGEALRIDPRLLEAYALEHTYAFFFNWDWTSAAAAREKLLQSVAAEVDPQYFRALPLERWALGYPDEALALARRVRQIDPFSPDLMTLEADYLLNTGELEAAAALYEQALALEPTGSRAFGLAEAKFRQKKFDEAIAARVRAHDLSDDVDMVPLFEKARGEAGYRQADRAWTLAELEGFKRKTLIRYVSPLDFARTYAKLGDRQQALKYLQESLIEHSPALVLLNVDRAWDLIRDDPEFREVVAKVGLPVDKRH
jgi:tetratricopeptide (TPR) repeat protein